MGEEVIKVLKHLGDQFGVAIDWSSANIMPYLNDLMGRIVKYGIYINIYNIFYKIFCIALFVGITVVLYKLANRALIKQKNSEDNLAEALSIAYVVSCVATVVVIVVGMVGISDSVTNIIELNTVPEKYVIEMIQDKINENKGE